MLSSAAARSSRSPSESKFDAPFGEGGGISAQAHALGDRIRHVTALAAGDPRFREVHPELCFTAMNGMKRLKFRKKSAGGAFERLALLQKHGINIDRGSLGKAATVPLDDLLDAAACAWTAARKDAISLPDPPEVRDGARGRDLVLSVRSGDRPAKHAVDVRAPAC